MRLSFLLFPFYRPRRHHFLMRRWWFRLLTVVYIAALVVWPFASWNTWMQEDNRRCLTSRGFPLHATSADINDCTAQSRRNWTDPEVLEMTVVPPIVILYIGQLVFFAIGVDFIAGVKLREEHRAQSA